MLTKDEKHCKQLGLTKLETKTYLVCRGQCTNCMLNGDCELKHKIKGEKL